MEKSKTLCKKLISIVLSLLMVFSCFSGMSLTAYAVDNTAAEVLKPTVTDGKVTNAKVLEYAGKQWYVIASGGEGVQIANGAVASQTGKTTLVLLAKEDWRPKSYGLYFYTGNGSSSVYSSSNLKTTIDGLVTSEKIGNYYTSEDEKWKNGLVATRTLAGEANFVSDFASVDKICGPKLTGATLWPLSAKEVSQINNRTILNGSWWLRSPGKSDGNAACVDNGSLNEIYVKNLNYGVRPALCLNLTSDIFASKKSGSVYELTKEAPHNHNFTYSADGATLTATCNGAEGCDLTDKKTTLTITAPTLTTYGGTGNATATLTGLADFNTATGKTIAATDIKYVGRDGTTYEESTTAPTNAGKYTAKITVEAKTASVDYEIAKADPTAPTGLTATYGQTLANVTLPTGWTWADSTQSVGNVGTKTFKANFTPADTTNYNTVENVDVTVKVNPADITPTVTLEGWTYGDEANTPSVTGNAGNGDIAYTYAQKGSNNFSATVPTNAGNYTVKATVAATTNYNGGTATADFTIAKANITPTVSIDGWTYNQTAKTPSVSGNTGNGAVTYTYATKGSDSFSATVPTNAGNYTVKATIAATANYNGATATADFTIAKADPTYTVPTDLYATYGDTLADVTLPTGWAWADNTASVGNAGTNTFKANFTPADTANYNTVNNVDVTVKVSKADPTYEAPKGLYATYGDTLADVALPTGWAWVDGTTSVGDAGKKTFKANFTPADTANYNTVENVDVTVKVNQAEITPTVTLEGWTYGDEANKPSVTGNTGNGDVTYLYKEKGASDMSCTEVVPTEAGEYTVKALVYETQNYTGGEAEADFTIAKAKVTVTADDKTSKREAALKELTYKVDGKILDGDDLGITVSSDVKADVAGKYDIKVAYTENANYDVTTVDGIYTVTDRITATEKTAGKNKINSAAKVTASKKGVTVKWGAVANAEKYEIYATYCGKDSKYKKIKTVKGNVTSFEITKLGGKKVDTSKCLKVYVVAYRKVNGKYEKISKSFYLHIAGAQNKHTNAKAINVKKSSYTLKVNKTATMKPTLVLEKKNKKAVDHVAKFRYLSTNTAVATVDKNGKITAKGKGTCTIYIFANNGNLKSVKVTVK